MAPDAPAPGLEEHVSFDTLRSIVGDALHATAYGSGHRVVWPARYAAHVDLLLRILAQKDATIAELRELTERLAAQSERPKCLYCTFGEDADFSVEDLKRHIESECDFHPMRRLREALEREHEWHIKGCGHVHQSHDPGTCRVCALLAPAPRET